MFRKDESVGAVTANLGCLKTIGVHHRQLEPFVRALRTSYPVNRGPARGRELRLLHRHLRVLSIAAFLLLCTLPRAAKGQNSPEDRNEGASASTSTDYDNLLDRAVDAFDKADYPRARDLFEQAYALRPNARVLRGLGISAVHLERYTVAKRELTEALRETRQPLTANQREGVTELLSWMEANCGTLRLDLEPADAYVTLDDEPVSGTELIVKPGSHRVTARLNGFATQSHTVEVGPGQKRTLDIALQPSALKGKPAVSAADAASAAPMARNSAASPSPLAPSEAHESGSSSVLDRWWFWTAVGVVVAGGVATTVALTSNQPAKSYEKGGLGGVIMPLGRMP
jgi:tetratricopeptide (TPR) repeat protein